MPVRYILPALIPIIILLCALLLRARLSYARQKVQLSSEAEKLELLAGLAGPYGFQYDPAADCFYSEVHCWQRKYGYRYVFDSSAAALGMIFDCEPVYFDYGGRHWLVEFWKGQYGMSAGAEAGIYAADDSQSRSSDPRLRHYKSIGDSELFPMRMCIFHGDALLAVRELEHWWLTAFFPGKYCPPQTLTAKVSITFPDYGMCNAYIDGLKRAGYASTDISRCLRTVTVPFTVPRTAQPTAQRSAHARLRLSLNRLCCFLYRHLTKGFTNTPDRLMYLASLSPALAGMALRFARAQRRYNRYHKASNTTDAR